MAIEQREDGAVAGVVPEINQDWNGQFRTRISAAWGDAATVCPWEVYMAYGDRELLAENFEMMRKWVDYIHSAGPEEFLWLGGRHYGDWLAMDATPDVYMGATPTDFIASAYFAYSTNFFSHLLFLTCIFFPIYSPPACIFFFLNHNKKRSKLKPTPLSHIKPFRSNLCNRTLLFVGCIRNDLINHYRCTRDGNQ
jgi:hypothetical protein